jgi:hypothetical protein
MTDDDVRALLRQLRDDPVPADSLARVRLAVAERTADTDARHFGMAWRFAGVLAAMAVVVLVAVLVRPSQRPVSPTAKVRESAAAIQVSTPSIVKTEPRNTTGIAPARLKKKPRRSAAAESKDVVVRIETADPDVVILLIGD